MAKEFKDWDKKFTSSQIILERVRWMGLLWEARDGLMYWGYAVTQYPQDQVLFAVYKAEDAHKWQLFRVALKGLTTQKKLLMLHFRYNYLVIEKRPNFIHSDEGRQIKIEQVRISNYIGAIVRSGHLNSRYEVVR